MNRVFNFSLFSGLMFATVGTNNSQRSGYVLPPSLGVLFQPRKPWFWIGVIIIGTLLWSMSRTDSYDQAIEPLTPEGYYQIYQRVLYGDHRRVGDVAKLTYFCNEYQCSSDASCVELQERICTWLGHTFPYPVDDPDIRGSRTLVLGHPFNPYGLFHEDRLAYARYLYELGEVDFAEQIVFSVLRENPEEQFAKNLLLEFRGFPYGIDADFDVSVNMSEYLVWYFLHEGDVEAARTVLFSMLINNRYSSRILRSLIDFLPYDRDFAIGWIRHIVSGSSSSTFYYHAYFLLEVTGEYDLLDIVERRVREHFPGVLDDLIHRYRILGYYDVVSVLSQDRFLDNVELYPYMDNTQREALSRAPDYYRALNNNPKVERSYGLYAQGLKFSSSFKYQRAFNNIVKLQELGEHELAKRLLSEIAGYPVDSDLYQFLLSDHFRSSVQSFEREVSNGFNEDMLYKVKCLYTIYPQSSYFIEYLGYYYGRDSDAAFMFENGLRLVSKKKELKHLLHFAYTHGFESQPVTLIYAEAVRRGLADVICETALMLIADQKYDLAVSAVVDYVALCRLLGISFTDVSSYKKASSRLDLQNITVEDIMPDEKFFSLLNMYSHEEYDQILAKFTDAQGDYTLQELCVALESALILEHTTMVVRLYSLVASRSEAVAARYTSRVDQYFLLWHARSRRRISSPYVSSSSKVWNDIILKHPINQIARSVTVNPNSPGSRFKTDDRWWISD